MTDDRVPRPRRVFLTGGAGFIGSHVLARLVAVGHDVVALDRSGAMAGTPAGARVVRGDLLDRSTYQAALRGVDVVVHLAAATGRASRAEHVRVNAVATATLLHACRDAGAPRFVFVSTIAVTFPDVRDYPYAQAKIQAETAVRESGLPFVILRPTMVLGPGSPIQSALERLAGLPMVPVFGSGQVRVQPIDVAEAAERIAAAVDRDDWTGQTVDVAGPEIVTIQELLQRLRETRTRRRGRVLHVPLGLMLPPLRALEAVGLGRLLPLSAGQLSTFRFDGVAASRRAGSSDPGTPPGSQDPGILDERGLGRECRTFCRYLIGVEASPYIMTTYRELHGRSPVFTGGDRFDRLLVRVAARGRVQATIADAYARHFAPAGLLRQKLVLLLAILETSAPSHRVVDASPGGSTASVLLRLAGRGTLAVLSLLVGTAVFAPIRVAIRSEPRA